MYKRQVDDLLKHIGTGRQGGAGNGQYQQDTLRVAPKAATQGIAILFHGMFVIGFAETSRQLVSRCQKKIWHLPAAQNYKRLADCQNHLWFSFKQVGHFPARRKNVQNTDLRCV